MAGNLVKAFNCPECGANVVIRAAGHTVSVACSSCSSVIDTSNESHRVISKALHALKSIEPPIPLGTRGKLHGTLWEIIGFLKRRDQMSQFEWHEYLLFNPQKGFRWLTQAGGHWNYVLNIKGTPLVAGGYAHGSRAHATYLDKTYQQFHDGTALTVIVLGEFYWKARVGESASVKDFVSPPEVLSYEKKEDEVTWSLGEYIDAETVRAAFPVIGEMPVQLNVAPNQPSKLGAMAPDIKLLWAFFAGILFFIQIVAVAFTQGKVVNTSTQRFDPRVPSVSQSSEPFELKESIANVKVEVWALVKNSWLEVQGDLVNDLTGDTIDFERGVEFYEGYDSDGRWAEGSQINDTIISAVPGGTYHLNMQASSAVSEPIDYTVRVTRDVPTWSNFFWFLIFISIFPIIIWWRARSFEVQRWSESDYSPYSSHQDSEDE